MAKRYNQRPSQLMEISNEYLAYIFDEVAMFLEDKATDKEGTLDWDKIKWSDKEVIANGNKELMKLANKGK